MIKQADLDRAEGEALLRAEKISYHGTDPVNLAQPHFRVHGERDKAARLSIGDRHQRSFQQKVPVSGLPVYRHRVMDIGPDTVLG